MNRRQFSQRLAALIATPALPARTAVAATGPAAATGVVVPAGAYGWAEYLMKLHQTCTPAMLKSILNVSDHAARSLHAELVRQGVISRTGAVSRGLKLRQKRREKAVPDSGSNGLDVVIGPATTADIPALVPIWHQGWHDAHSAHVPDELCAQRTPESFRARLEKNLGYTRVARVDGTVAGFHMLRADELFQFYVERDHRGRGVAAKLMADAELRLQEQGVSDAFLHVVPENRRAVAFYNRLGWVGDEIEPALLETLDQPYELACLVLRKNLTPDTN